MGKAVGKTVGKAVGILGKVKKKKKEQKKEKNLIELAIRDLKKVMQELDSVRQKEKRAKIGAGYENSFDPNKGWNLKLDADLERHCILRSKETSEEIKSWREKDKYYQRKKRLEQTCEEKKEIPLRKKEYQRIKRQNANTIRSE